MSDPVVKAAEKYRLDPRIFGALVRQESGGRQSARSRAGAIGETQLMPATARSLGVDPYDATQNLEGGAKYLRQQLDHFHDDYRLALAAYNAGPGAVTKYGGVPPFRETQAYVKNIMSMAGTSGAPSATSQRTVSAPQSRQPSPVATRTVGGVDNKAARGALIASFLQGGDPRFTQGTSASGLETRDPVQFALAVRSLKDVPGRTVTTPTPAAPASGAAAAASSTGAYRQRADAIDAKKLPYQWGGGHAGKVDAYRAQPLDCSGAVSAVLGINPRVSGQFTAWGNPGDGGSRGVTVYANGHHVLMKINGHFFGTSSTNPGGGAGWIPESAISPDYLKGFTARHA